MPELIDGSAVRSGVGVKIVFVAGAVVGGTSVGVAFGDSGAPALHPITKIMTNVIPIVERNNLCLMSLL